MIEQRLGDLTILIGIIVGAVGILWVTPNYPEYLRHFPEFTGIFMILLGASGLLRMAVQRLWVGNNAPSTEEIPLPMPVPLRMMAVVGFFCILVIFFGFFVGLPLFFFLFLWLGGKRRAAEAAIVAVAMIAVLWVIGHYIDQLKMYPGILFGGFVPRW